MTALQDGVETWELLPLPSGTFRYVFAKDGDGRVTGTWIPGPGALSRFLVNHRDQSCYIQLNPANQRGLVRPTAKEVSHLQAILLDVDPVEAGAEAGAAMARVAEVCTSLGVPTTCISLINTGRGLQFWLHLDPIPIIGEGSLARAVRKFIWAVAGRVGTSHGCRVDTSCADLGRLARLPGSVNQKTGKKASIISRGSPVPALFLFPFDEEVVDAVAAPPPRALRTKWPEIAVHLTRTAQEYITLGSEEPGRHRAAFATAKSLKEACVEPEVALHLLLLGAGRCAPELPLSDASRIFRQVFEEKHFG